MMVHGLGLRVACGMRERCRVLERPAQLPFRSDRLVEPIQ